MPKELMKLKNKRLRNATPTKKSKHKLQKAKVNVMTN